MWRTLRALTRHERGVLLEVVVACVSVTVGLRVLPLPRLLRLLRRPVRSPACSPPEIAELQRWAAVCFRHAPCRMTCLTRALVLQRLLRRRGLPADVRIGCAPQGEALRAHAWVEHDGRVLLDDPAVSRQFPAVFSLVTPLHPLHPDAVAGVDL